MDLTDEIRTELEGAETARLLGNEGRARVCARRAAGLAARDFFVRHKARANTSSAYKALQELATYPGLAPELKQAAAHLTMRITEEFTLPVEVDLIAEARKLIGGLS